MEILTFLNNVSGVVSLVVAGAAAWLHWKLRAERAELINELLAVINSKYIKRDEVGLLKAAADKDHERYETEIRTLHGRINDIIREER